MFVTQNVSTFDHKFLELVALIDRGEYGLETTGDTLDVFGGWRAKMVFEGHENYGMLSACVFADALRVHVVFRHDVNSLDTDGIITPLQHAINQCQCRHVFIWCTQENPHLIQTLQTAFTVQDDLYMAYELAYAREAISRQVDISPLIAKPFTDDVLDETLNLLEHAMQHVSHPGTYIRQKSALREKFSTRDRARCEGFFLDDELVGMYFHHDAEIEYVAVAETHQNKGYGALMLKRALSKIAADSDHEPHLYCVNANTRALTFYQREGWKITGKPVRLHIQERPEAADVRRWTACQK